MLTVEVIMHFHHICVVTLLTMFLALQPLLCFFSFPCGWDLLSDFAWDRKPFSNRSEVKKRLCLTIIFICFRESISPHKHKGRVTIWTSVTQKSSIWYGAFICWCIYSKSFYIWLSLKRVVVICCCFCCTEEDHNSF